MRGVGGRLKGGSEVRTVGSQSLEISIGRKAGVGVAGGLHVEAGGRQGEVDAEEATGGGGEKEGAA